MLERIHIENFKSLKNITVDLQRVNLLIGTNNSGKSNFLKAIQFFLRNYYKSQYSLQNVDVNDELFFRKNINNDLLMNFSEKDFSYEIIFNITKQKYNSYKWSINDLGKKEYLVVRSTLTSIFGEGIIYQPFPDTFLKTSELIAVDSLDEKCSNIIPFLFNLSQNHKKRFAELENNLAECVGEFVSLGTPAIIENQQSRLALKLFDKNDNAYWAREVSEGVLYFLALLCIIHQPNPPKLLLLEEPERGIHPRRIREVLDFIFNLAYEKDIQVIMTTHNERVLNYFEDTPEAVFVFDKDEEGATQIKNLKNIIEESDREMQEKGLPKIPFTESLGEHWVTGFIGGVPKSFY